jgi:ATP-independent RNA helicase DbpA
MALLARFMEARESHKVESFGVDLVEHNYLLPDNSYLDKPIIKPLMTTLKIDGGKKQKLRPGDIVGGLTGIGGILGDEIGKIKVLNSWSYVAVNTAAAKMALKKIQKDKLKGKSFRVHILR